MSDPTAPDDTTGGHAGPSEGADPTVGSDASAAPDEPTVDAPAAEPPQAGPPTEAPAPGWNPYTGEQQPVAAAATDPSTDADAARRRSRLVAAGIAGASAVALVVGMAIGSQVGGDSPATTPGSAGQIGQVTPDAQGQGQGLGSGPPQGFGQDQDGQGSSPFGGGPPQGLDQDQDEQGSSDVPGIDQGDGQTSPAPDTNSAPSPG